MNHPDDLNGSKQPDHKDSNKASYEYYSYSSKSGDHKNSSENNGQYEWNFASYDQVSRDRNRTAKNKNKGIRVFATVLAGVFVIGLLTFAGYGLYTLFVPSNLSSTSSEITSSGLYLYNNPEVSKVPSETGELTTKEIAKTVGPSVVGVVQYKKSIPYVASGAGSGIILDKEGYIVTNAHVISGADSVKIVLSSGEEYSARIIGSDAKTDLAVLKITAHNLIPAKLGNSNQLEIGEEVVAIGNPGGLSGSVSKGIISGLNRTVETNIGASMKCIQTDAAINPGNSGGALVNQYGYIVGINSSKIAATDYEGIGFAIPISDAKPIIEDLKAHGSVQGRVRIGIEVRMIDDVLAKLNNIPAGAMVIRVEENSDASKKGLLSGDIITHINGISITTYNDLYDEIAKHQVGDTVALKVYRTGQNNTSQTLDISIQLMAEKDTNS